MVVRDTRMMASAIEQRWPMSPEVRKAVIGKLIKVMASPDASPREVTSAAKALLAAEAQNQKDEHKIIDVRVHRKLSELAGIAAELGIDVDLVANAERSSSGGPGRIEAADDQQPGDGVR